MQVLISIIFFSVWLAPHGYFIGWLEDDWVIFRKGLLVKDNWINIFSASQNIIHLHTLLLQPLYSLKNLAPQAIPYPINDPDVGLFRLISLVMVVCHLLISLHWLNFARHLSGSRAAAFISTLLLIASPFFVLWTPQLDSRFLAMPFLLCGLSFIFDDVRYIHDKKYLHQDLPSLSSRIVRLFFAGLFLSLSVSVIYHTLMLSVTVLIVYTLLVALYHSWHLTGILFMALVAGFVLWPISLEILAALYLNPADVTYPASPLAYMFAHRAMHYYGDGFLSSGMQESWNLYLVIGPTILVSILVVILHDWVHAKIGGQISIVYKPEFLISASLFISIILALSDGSYPIAHQHVYHFPFVFLLAAIGVVKLAKLFTSEVYRLIILIFGTILLIAPTSVMSKEVYDNHWTLGRSVLAAFKLLPADRHIIWMVNRARPYQPETLISGSHSDDLVIVAHPRPLFVSYPSFIGVIEEAKPLIQEKHQWSSELTNLDWRAQHGQEYKRVKAFSDVLVYRVEELKRVMSPQQILRVSKVSASSYLSEHEPWHLLDHDVPGTGMSSWQSVSSDGQPPSSSNWVEMELAETYAINHLQIIGKFDEQNQCFADALQIEGMDKSDGHWSTLWRGNNLHLSPLIDAHFEIKQVKRLRFTFYSCQTIFGKKNTSQAVEEIRFPGYYTEYVGEFIGVRHPELENFGGYVDEIEPSRSWCLRQLTCYVDLVKGRVLRIFGKDPRPMMWVVTGNGMPLPSHYDHHISHSLTARLPNGVGRYEIRLQDSSGRLQSRPEFLDFFE